ncbi:MAG: hypothetical protein JXL97_08110 [Bacteroidales bacterium]|nr:hypothetical protein [Bacteroidales bacterium]
MQKDFHYYVIRILSEKAGFKPEEAQIIAYASQFVDDATEHKPIELPQNYKIEHPRLSGQIFDPVCTAHKGLQFLNDFRKEVQMKIYMSFHFLPAEIYTNQEDYNYVTKPNSFFAKKLIENVKEKFHNNDKNITYNLVALGIAIHTFADTWAHQNFSGRNNIENGIKRIKTWNIGKWKYIGAINQFRNNLLPQIGHAEAYSLPDLPYETWKFKSEKDNTSQIRHNLDIYIEAAEEIYKVFLDITKKENIWNQFSDRLIYCLSYINDSLKKRKTKYKKYFPEIGFYYNEKEWKNEIFKTKFPYKSLKIKKKEIELKWLYFHQAAFEQRNFILGNIKPL